MTRPLGWKPRTRPDLAERLIDGEALIVNAERGEIVVLNATGAFLWPLLDGTRDVATLVTLTCDEFDVDPAIARADVEIFLSSLDERGALAEES